MTATIKNRTRVNSAAANGQAQRKADYLAGAAAVKLAGEVVTWHAGDATHTHAMVVAALKTSGLDETIARELLPRHAFSRAARKLQAERIIAQLRDESDTLTFQFTKAFLTADEWQYQKEAIVSLDKKSGKITCPVDAGLEALAQAELDKAMEQRTPSDVTRIVQKLFEAEADLFPIREQGGAYMVLAEHIGFADRVHRFLEALGGRMQRLPIAAGTPQGDASVEQIVVSGIQGIITDHEKAVAAFGVDTRADTLERAAERITQTRVKLQAYQHYLRERADELVQALNRSNDALKARVALIAKAKEAEFAVDCDHCGAPNDVKEGAKGCRCSTCGKEFSIEW